MDLHALRAFRALAATLHFGKAGRDCYLSPSGISRTIRRLEEEVGRPLFLRDHRSVRLTPAGERFRQFAQDVLDRWERFRESLAQEQAVLRGELALYCSVTASYSVLAGLFTRFRRRYPEIHIRLQTGDEADAVEKVRSGEADVTVAARPARLPESLLFKIITLTPLLFIAPTVPCDVTALTGGGEIRWAEVPMILSERGLSRRRVDAWFAARGLRPRIYAEVSGHEAIISMVRLGCGVGVVPRLVLDQSSLREEIRELAVDPLLEPYAVGLCVHRRRLASPIVEAFWNTAEERPE